MDSTDNLTSCDEDFTWVCSSKEKSSEPNVPSIAYTTKAATIRHSHGKSDDVDIKNSNIGQKRGRQLKPSSSLDRRRIQSRNRQERDTKSRSVHSLHESSATSTTDYASPEYPSGIFIDFELYF